MILYFHRVSEERQLKVLAGLSLHDLPVGKLEEVWLIYVGCISPSESGKSRGAFGKSAVSCT